MDLQLKAKKALVTGSTAGIGFAIARGLAAEGASVIVNGRTEKRVDSASKEPFSAISACPPNTRSVVDSDTPLEA